jgi:prephenate dehydratase
MRSTCCWSGCVTADRRPAIAYQGEAGAYSEEAVHGYFGAGAVACPAPTFSAVCAAVESGEAVAAVLPVENSLAGTVGEALDAIARSGLIVVGEVLLPIRHQLLGVAGASMDSVRSVMSHRQALAQCEAFLARRGWRLVVAEDTAGAARALAQRPDRAMAVIASSRAADHYGLRVLARDIEDADDNQTRFAVVARRDGASLSAAGPLAPGSGAPRATLIEFETRHMAGALHHALGAFAEAGVSMTRIESRPTGRVRWQYRFLVAVEGDAAVEPLRGALRELRARAHGVRVLGSFPAAT